MSARNLRNVDDLDRWDESGGSERYAGRVLGELRSLVGDAERLFRQVADTSSDKLSGMRTQFDRRLERTRDQLDRTRRMLGDGARAQTEAARGHIRDNPLRSVGIATAAGVVVGLLVVTILNNNRR